MIFGFHISFFSFSFSSLLLGKVLPKVARDERMMKVPGVMQKVMDAFNEICFPETFGSFSFSPRRLHKVSNPDIDGAGWTNTIKYDSAKKTYQKMNFNGGAPESIIGHAIEKNKCRWTFSVDYLVRFDRLSVTKFQCYQSILLDLTTCFQLSRA